MKLIVPGKSGGVTLLGMTLVSASCLWGLVGAASAVTAAPAPSASSWPAQVVRPAPASCPRGQTLVAPTSGWTDALGVIRLTYANAPGLVAKVPPRGLTAGRVTPAMISDLGIPGGSAPGSRPGRAVVQRVLSLTKNRTAPEFCRSTARKDEEIPAAPSGNRSVTWPRVHYDHRFSANWGGYEVTEAENGGSGINGAIGEWTVGQHSTMSQPSHSA